MVSCSPFWVHCVLTTHINGITEEDLKDKTPISQNEFDEIIKKFNLENRTILTYGSIDEKFIRTYCNRHKIKGFEKLKFFNFKHLLIQFLVLELKYQLYYYFQHKDNL